MTSADNLRGAATTYAFARLLGQHGFRRRGHRFTRHGFLGNVNVTLSTSGRYLVAFINDIPEFTSGQPHDFADLALTLDRRPKPWSQSDWAHAWALEEALLEEEATLDPDERTNWDVPTGPKPTRPVQKLALKMSRVGVPIDWQRLKSALTELSEEQHNLEKAVARRLHLAHSKLRSTTGRRRATKLLPTEYERLDRTTAHCDALRKLQAVEQLEANTPHQNPRLAVTWAPSVAVTGRWGCSPHIMSLPRVFRSVVKAPASRRIVVADLGAADVVVAGVLSGEQRLARAASTDVYEEVGRRLFPTDGINGLRRSVAKQVTLKSLYNAGGGVVLASLQRLDARYTRAAADYLRERWLEEHPAFERWRRHVYHSGNKHGRIAISPSRVIRFSPGSLSHEGQPAAWLVQGTVAALFDQMLLHLDARLSFVGCGAFIFGMVHDCVLVECDERDVVRVAREMRTALHIGHVAGRSYRFRVTVQAGPSWGELSEVPR